MLPGLIEGRIVLMVFLDGSNDLTQDRRHPDFPDGVQKVPQRTMWVTSRMESEAMEPGTWHGIERVDEKPAPAPIFDLTPATASGVVKGTAISGTGVGPAVSALTSHNSTSSEVAKAEVDEAKAAERMTGEGGKDGGK